MIYRITDPFWLALYDWQTLVAGILAVLAAFGTIWATINSANREIAAAQRQTDAALKQTALTLALDRRRIARESYAFFAMMNAATESTLEDVALARESARSINASAGNSREAFEVRQRLRRTGFPDLLTACVHLGGNLTGAFLGLDKAIDNFARQYIAVRGTYGGDQK
jgi:hypothetical protein